VVLGFLRALAGKGTDAAPAPERIAAPAAIEAPGAEPFVLADHMDVHVGFPVMRWQEAIAWVESVPSEAQGGTWDAVYRGWLLHLRDSLGPRFHVVEGSTAVVVSSHTARESAALLAFMEKTGNRILRLLDGIASEPDLGNEVLVVFDDQESYYRYVSRLYPDQGEFAFSGGMHINEVVSYYVTTKEDPRAIEPTIAHEMTHGFVRHLPLPLWLNEGLAVNTEARLCGAWSRFTPQEMRAKHLAFWGPGEIQQFWSGRSFGRPDEGNMLSYDLARILVEQLSRDWPRFAGFARAANWEDAGAQAAGEHFGTTLGELAAALLDREHEPSLEPDPAAWAEPAEHVPS